MIWTAAIFVIHWIADFLCQTRKMGLNKGKSIKWLNIHVLVYTLVTTLGWWILFTSGWKEVAFVFVVTFISHWITDFITSRASGYCYLRMLYHQKYKYDYKIHLRMEGHDDSTRQVIQRKMDKSEKDELMWQYNFWSIIGFDQLVHAVTLLMTINYLGKLF